MKTRPIYGLLTVTLLVSQLHAQSPASVTQHTQEKQQLSHDAGMSKPNQTATQDSTQKLSNGKPQKIQKPQTTPDKQSASTKPNKKPKRGLITKKEFTQYLKTAVTTLGITGGILIIISDRAFNYIVGGASKAGNSILGHNAAPVNYAAPVNPSQLSQFLESRKKKAIIKDLFSAIRDKKPSEEIEFLISQNADVNAVIGDHTPLSCAAIHGNAAVIKILIDHNANVDATSGSFRNTALIEATRKKHVDVVRELIAGRANVNLEDKGGKPALTWAIRNNDATTLKLLLDNNADGSRALSSSCYNNAVSKETVGLLVTNESIRQKINIIHGQCWGTPLIFAIDSKDIGKVQVLLAHNADANIPDIYGNIPLEYAAAVNDSGDLVRILLQHNATPQHIALIKAAMHNRVNAIEQLLAQGIPIDAVGKYGKTALAETAAHKHLEAMQLLLAHKADPNVVSRANGQTYTPLHLALSFHSHQQKNPDYAKLVETLINANANINAQDNKGQTPLHCAAQDGRTQVVRLLLQNGADRNITDDGGHTPSYYAPTKDTKRLFGIPEKDLGDLPNRVEDPHVIKKKKFKANFGKVFDEAAIKQGLKRKK